MSDVIHNPTSIIPQAGCTAIALVARFPDDEDPVMLQAYRQGCGVDAVGGAEAIISHLVTAGKGEEEEEEEVCIVCVGR